MRGATVTSPALLPRSSDVSGGRGEESRQQEAPLVLTHTSPAHPHTRGGRTVGLRNRLRSGHWEQPRRAPPSTTSSHLPTFQVWMVSFFVAVCLLLRLVRRMRQSESGNGWQWANVHYDKVAGWLPSPPSHPNCAGLGRAKLGPRPHLEPSPPHLMRLAVGEGGEFRVRRTTGGLGLPLRMCSASLRPRPRGGGLNWR